MRHAPPNPRRLRPVSFCLAAALCLLTTLARALEIVVPDADTYPDSTRIVSVLVREADALASGHLTLTYHPDRLTLERVLSPDPDTKFAISATPGYTEVAFACAAPRSGDFVLLDLHLRTAAEAVPDELLDLTLTATSINEDAPLPTVTSGVLTVRAGERRIDLAGLPAVIAVDASAQGQANGGSEPYEWGSTAPQQASVETGTGVVRALAAGHTTIFARDTDGFTGYAPELQVTNLAPRALAAGEALGAPGRHVAVPLNLWAGPGVSSFRADIEFPATLTLLDVFPFADSANWRFSWHDTADGATVAGAGSTSVADGGPLGYLLFQVDSDAPTSVRLPLDVIAASLDEGAVYAHVEGGGIQMVSPYDLPTLAVTSGTERIGIGGALTPEPPADDLSWLWHSTAPGIASVDPETGEATGLSPGIFRIVAVGSDGTSLTSGELRVTDTTPIRLTAVSTEGLAGQTVAVSIRAEPDAGVRSFYGELRFDPGLVTPVQFLPGEGAQGCRTSWWTTPDGRVTLALAGDGRPPGPEIATLFFYISGNAHGGDVSHVTWETVQLNESTLNLTAVDGTITVVGGREPAPPLHVDLPASRVAAGDSLRATAHGGLAPYTWSAFGSVAPVTDPASGPTTDFRSDVAGRFSVRVTDSQGRSAYAGPIEVFAAESRVVGLPPEPVLCSPGQQGLAVPLSVDSADGVYSVLATLSFEPSLLILSSVQLGEVCLGAEIETEEGAGFVRVAIASDTPFQGTGALFELVFDVKPEATAGAEATVELDLLQFNEGLVPTNAYTAIIGGEGGLIGAFPTTGVDTRFVVVHDAPATPDLAVTGIGATPSYDIQVGDVATVRADLINLGSPIAAGSTAAFSVDGEPLETVSLGRDWQTGETRRATFYWIATGGEHTLRVEADPNADLAESDETNNALEFAISATSSPDLVVDSVDAYPRDGLVGGDTVALSAVVRNAGTATVLAPIPLRFAVDGLPVAAATHTGGLPPGASVNLQANWTAGPGTELAATVDPDDTISESNEDNNARNALLPTIALPDFDVEILTPDWPESVYARTRLPLVIRVRNLGALDVLTDVPVRLAANGREQDMGWLRAGIRAGEERDLQLLWNTDPGAAHTLVATVDPLDAIVEADEANNQDTLASDLPVIPVQYRLLVDQAERTTVRGTPLTYTLTVDNYDQVRGTFAIALDPGDLPEDTATLSAESLTLIPGRRGAVELQIDIPVDYAIAEPVTHHFSASATFGAETRTVELALTVEPVPVAHGLVPADGARLGSNNVTFTWTTFGEATGRVFLRQVGQTEYREFDYDGGIWGQREGRRNHAIPVGLLERERDYEYYVQSANAAGTHTSEVRRFRVTSGIVFSQETYQFNIEKDYEQNVTLQVQNTDDTPHHLLIRHRDLSSDELVVGFIGAGSEDLIVPLNPGETFDVTLGIMAADATREDYQLIAEISSDDGNEVLHDTAVVHIHVRQPVFDLLIEELNVDPHTLARTYRITNRGDTLNDLGMLVDEGLLPNVLFEPTLEHARLRNGRSILVKAYPILTSFIDDPDQPANGNITFRSGIGEQEFPIDFTPPDGKTLEAVELEDVMYVASNYDWYCTNRPKIHMNFNVPAGFGHDDVDKANLTVYFVPRSSTRAHNIHVLLNDVPVHSFLNTVPSGRYEMEIPMQDDPSTPDVVESALILPRAGMAVNRLTLVTEHMNGGHYVVSTTFQLHITLKEVRMGVCVGPGEDAAAIAPNLDQFQPQPSTWDLHAVDLLRDWETLPDRAFVSPGEPIRIRAHAVDGSGSLYMSAKFSNGDPSILLTPDGGGYGYEGTWHPGSPGSGDEELITVTVHSGACHNGNGGNGMSRVVTTSEDSAGPEQVTWEEGQALGTESLRETTGSANDPVNTATGNFVHQEIDISMPALGGETAFARSYNSRDTYTGDLGTGWTHNYNSFLTVLEGPEVLIKTPDGRVDKFLPDGAGGWYPAYSNRHEVLRRRTNGIWTLQRTDLTLYSFDTDGKLLSIQDRNGNMLSCTYDADTGRLAVITDPVGRQFTFAYTGDRLTSVTDHTGRRVAYTYTGDLLTGVVDVLEGTIAYGYDDDGLLASITDQRGVRTVYNVYEDGRVVEQSDGNGNTSDFAYDLAEPGTGATTVTDPLGNAVVHHHEDYLLLHIDYPNEASVAYTYDEDKNRTSITDRNGNTVRFGYDDLGNLVETVQPDGGTTTVSYDDARFPHLPTRSVNPVGMVTEWEYDERGNTLLERTGAGTDLAAETTWTYNDWGRVLTETDPENNTVIYRYQETGEALGQLVETQDPTGNITRFGYNDLWRLTTVTDPRGNELGDADHTVTTVYDAAGRVTDVIGPLFSTHMEYDAVGNRTLQRDANGNETTYEYDGNGNLRFVREPLGRTSETRYDALNRKVRTSDPSGAETAFAYDTMGNLTTVTRTLPDGRVDYTTTNTHDLHGNVLTSQDPSGRVVTTTYNTMNRKLTETDHAGNTRSWTYDRLGRVKRAVDARGNPTRYTYDELGRLSTVTVWDDAGTPQVTAYEYDATGNLTAVTDPAGRRFEKEYNSLGLVSKERDGLGNEVAYSYDEVGNLTQVVTANNDTLTFQYDNASRMTAAYLGDELRTSYEYDAKGNRITMTDDAGTTTYGYDELDRLVENTDPFGNTVQYSYDASGNRTGITYPGDLTVSYDYDSLGQLTSVTDWNEAVTLYGYDQTGRLTSVEYPNGMTETRTYDDAGYLASLVYTTGDSVLLGYSWERDAEGLPVNRYEEGTLQPIPRVPDEVTYTYDEDNRLVSSSEGDYTYDDNGNLVERTVNGVTTAFAYDENDRLVRQTTGGRVVEHEYDGDGQRIARTENGVETRYVLDHGRSMSHVLCETDADGAVVARYVHGPRISARIAADSTTSYYLTDAVGSVTALADDTGAITDRYAYTPFGIPAGREGTTPNPFTYVGALGVMAEADNMYFMRARFYDPGTGLFVSKDSLESPQWASAVNPAYGYAQNSPLLHIDPTGHYAQLAWKSLETGLDIIGAGSFMLVTAPASAVIELISGIHMAAGVLTGNEALQDQARRYHYASLGIGTYPIDKLRNRFWTRWAGVPVQRQPSTEWMDRAGLMPETRMVLDKADTAWSVFRALSAAEKLGKMALKSGHNLYNALKSKGEITRLLHNMPQHAQVFYGSGGRTSVAQMAGERHMFEHGVALADSQVWDAAGNFIYYSARSAHNGYRVYGTLEPYYHGREAVEISHDLRHSFTHDSLARLSQSVGFAGDALSYTYDASGNRLSRTFQEGDVDTDEDGLPDSWERRYGLDSGLDDSTADLDGDGEDNLTEFTNGTDPTDALSTTEPGNAYVYFDFQIRHDTAPDEPITDTWRALLVCTPRGSEEFLSGTLLRPSHAIGDRELPLTVSADGTAGLEFAEFANLDELIAAFPGGEYRVHLVTDTGIREEAALQFIIRLPSYTADDFPAVAGITAPEHQATEVLLDPLLQFDSEAWDSIEARPNTPGTPWYRHARDAEETAGHQVPAGNRLLPDTEYRLAVLTTDWGHSWLAAGSVITFTTLPTLTLAPQPAALTVPEGDTASITLQLSAAPVGTVSLSVALEGDAPLVIDSETTLTFDRDNWETPRTITLSAAEDNDNTTAETASLRISQLDGANPVTELTVPGSQADDDIALTITAGEGGSTDPADTVLVDTTDQMPYPVHAEADFGFAFQAWTGDVTGLADPAQPDTTLQTAADTTLHATFRRLPLEIQAVAPQAGDVTGIATNAVLVPGAVHVSEGATETFTVTPIYGLGPYRYTWALDNAAVGADQAEFAYTPPHDTVAHPDQERTLSLRCTVTDSLERTLATVTWSDIHVQDENRLPDATGITALLAPNTGTNTPNTLHNLACTLQGAATDPDNEDVPLLHHRFDWRTGQGTLIRSHETTDTTDTLPATRTSPGQWIYCEVYVLDAVGDRSPTPATSPQLGIYGIPTTCWELTLHVTGAQTDSLSLGMAPDATPATDPHYDLPAPAQGSTGFVGLRVPQPLGEDDLLLDRDLRTPATEDDWVVDVTAAAVAVELAWSGSPLPADGLCIRELPSNGESPDGLLYSDMALTTSVTIPANTTKRYRIEYGYLTFPLELINGWNLFSLPIRPADNTLRTELLGLSMAGLWTWNGEYYVEPETLDPGLACWVFLELDPETESHILSVRGIRAAQTIFPRTQGWHTLGPTGIPPYPARVPPVEPDGLQTRFWKWSQGAYSETADQLDCGTGYWEFIYPARRRTLENPR